MLSSSNLPLVSICISAYNHERYVQEAIQSIIDQDYPRIELIVTDDGSKDSTWAKIEEMRSACAKRFERVVLRTRENKGRVITGQENLSLTHGEFIGELASDDRYLLGAISKLVKPMIVDSSIGLTVGRNIIIDADGRKCYWDARRNVVYDKESAVYRNFDEYIEGYSGISLKGSKFGSYSELSFENHVGNGQLRRKCLYEKIIPYDKHAPLEDLWLLLQFSKVTHFKYIDEDLFCYRWHGANTASHGAYMYLIEMQTLYHELECLKRKNDLEYLYKFSRRRPILVPFITIRLGWHHAGIFCVSSFNYKQYRLRAGKFHINIPLTPKLGLKCFNACGLGAKESPLRGANFPEKEIDKMPVVSFCLTCYNQKRYIDDAVKSALNQDYQNLEIVVVDDRSDDGTYAHVRKVISSYKGAHSIVCIQNDKRLGVVKNYEKAFKLSRGKLIVTGAGDDVSNKNRVSEIVRAWQEGGESATVITHWADLIDVQGKKIGVQENPNIERPLGALTAYDRRVVDLFDEIKEETAFEDDVFVKRALLLGEPLFIRKSLMCYRIGSGVSTNGEIIPRRLRVAERCLASARQIEQDMETCLISVPEDRLEARRRALETYVRVYSSEIEMIAGKHVCARFRALNRYVANGRFGLKRWLAYLIRFVFRLRR